MDVRRPVTSSAVHNCSVSLVHCCVSLTKVVATTSAAALLYQRGLLSLDTHVGDASLLGERFNNHGKGSIRVENLLLHNTGFPPDPVPNYWDPAFGCPATSQWHPQQTFSCSEMIFQRYASALCVTGGVGC